MNFVGSAVGCGSPNAGDFTGVAGRFSCGPSLGAAVVRAIALEYSQSQECTVTDL
jgi:hypothetical protein